jgi:hypothetical protein
VEKTSFSRRTGERGTSATARSARGREREEWQPSQNASETRFAPRDAVTATVQRRKAAR